ncbi:hypothetical protein, partial [Promineifilum sp.]|uniref:hypothetical protein n=1 Tax=Promineifilum sp. TaxID=2664178 RepID=UPI0035B0907F
MAGTLSQRETLWLERNRPVTLDGREELFVELIAALAETRPLTGRRYNHLVRAFARRGLPWLSKSQVLDA